MVLNLSPAPPRITPDMLDEAINQAIADAIAATTLPVAGYGMGIGQVPKFTDHGGLPAYELIGPWVLNQTTPTGTAGFDLQVLHDGSAVAAGTSANVNGLLSLVQTVGASDPTTNRTIYSHITTSSTHGVDALAAYLAADRLAGNAPLWASRMDVTCQTGLPSSAVGAETRTMTATFSSSLGDDMANAAKFGGLGNRHLVHYVAKRFSGASQNELSNGLWFGTSNSYYDSILGVEVNCAVRQVIDTRGAVPPAGVADPVAAVRLAHEQIIDLNGGNALNSAPGNYLQYTTTGTARARYMAGATEVLSVTDAGVLNLIGSYQVDGVKVVGNRDTGWAAMTGTPDKASAYDVASVTLAQLAGRVAQLQASLTAHGLLGL
jgi:hypothetical protein